MLVKCSVELHTTNRICTLYKMKKVHKMIKNLDFWVRLGLNFGSALGLS